MKSIQLAPKLNFPFVLKKLVIICRNAEMFKLMLFRVFKQTLFYRFIHLWRQSLCWVKVNHVCVFKYFLENLLIHYFAGQIALVGSNQHLFSVEKRACRRLDLRFTLAQCRFNWLRACKNAGFLQVHVNPIFHKKESLYSSL